MDLEQTGAGAGVGGVIGMILTLFGVKHKFAELDKKIERIEDRTVWRDTCMATHKSVDDGVKRIEKKLDDLIMHLSKEK